VKVPGNHLENAAPLMTLNEIAALDLACRFIRDNVTWDKVTAERFARLAVTIEVGRESQGINPYDY
jgi:hypothetical protein